jgi:hypothetical protein
MIWLKMLGNSAEILDDSVKTLGLLAETLGLFS